MEKTSKLKFNVVDVVAVVLLLAVLAFVGYKLANRGGGAVGETPTVTVKYSVKCAGVDAGLYDSCQKHLPSQLMASGALYDGEISSVTQEPYYVLDPTGHWVEDPACTTLTFQVEARIPKTQVMTTEIATQEVRVGKSDYILKSEFIEFKDAVITDVEWSE